MWTFRRYVSRDLFAKLLIILWTMISATEKNWTDKNKF